MPIHGKNTNVAIGGYDITRFLNEVSVTNPVETAETTTFDQPGNAKTYVLGQRDGTASFSGRFTDDVKNLRDIELELDALDYGAPLTLGVDRGFGVGKIVDMGAALHTAIAFSSPLADVVSVSGELQADGGWRTGVMLTPKAALTATLTGAQVDDTGAASATGWSANMHVSGNTRNGTVIVKVQHSTNGTTWVDLATFDTIAAAATNSGQRLVSASDTTSVSRYVRALVTLAGTTGEATVRVALARRK